LASAPAPCIGSSNPWPRHDRSAEAQNELLRLDDGDALSVQGGLRAEGGEPRVRLTVLADAVLPLRRPRKRQEPERAPAAAYDDAIPF
jgi:hypothetical protein